MKPGNNNVKRCGMERQRIFKRVGTHHGRFHADDVMATAILKEIYDIEIVRTRDEEVLKELDIVFDVGGGEFDHHDLEKEYRENEIPYAACGLIWRSFGREVVKFREPEFGEEEFEDVFGYVDRVLIQGIDALDNGLRPSDGGFQLMNISSILSGFNPPWHSEGDEDEAFKRAANHAGEVLNNVITNRISVLKAKEIVAEAYEKRPMPEIMVLDTFCPWQEALRDLDEKEEVLFVIYPSKDNFAMQTVRGRDYEDRKKLPCVWAGKRDEALAEVTGIEDSVFCHSGRFIAVAKSFEGIMRLALLAIKEEEERPRLSFLQRIKGFFSR